MEEDRDQDKTSVSEDFSPIYEGSKGPTIGARHVQIVLLSLGHSLAWCTKGIFSVAIVAMTDNSTSTENPNVPTYDWDNTSVIISAMLWSGILINLLGGYMGKRYGPKWFITCSTLLNGLFFIIIPTAAQYGGSNAVIACRVCQGIALGFITPLQAVVHGKWIPPEERSRFEFVCVGIMITMSTVSTTACGYIAASSLGWPWIFYTFGTLGLIWSAIYAFIGSQSPDAHPRINPDERQYLKETLRETEEGGRVPWRNILTAMPFWAIIIGQIGLHSILIMMQTELNIFLSKVMNYKIKENAVLSAIPSVVGLLAGAILSIVSDMSVKRRLFKIVTARRVFHLSGVTGMSICLIVITYIPIAYRAWSIVILCVGQAFIICSNIGGVGINILDVSPKYAGIVMGFANTVSQSVSVFGPLIVQWVCTDQTNPAQWRTVFLTTGAIALSSGTFFAIFASGDRQNWDDEPDPKDFDRRKSSVISVLAGMKTRMR